MGSKDIWVFLETDEYGRPVDAGCELLSEAAELAGKSGSTVTAVAAAAGIRDAAGAARSYGADRLIALEAPEFGCCLPDLLLNALYGPAVKYMPDTILMAATERGRELAPGLACMLETGLTADCTGLDSDEDGLITWTRPAFGGNLMADIVCAEKRPQMGTVRPGVFKKKKLEKQGFYIIREDITAENKQRIRLLEKERDPEEGPGLEGAGIIIAGGLGTGGPEGFELLKELAEETGAVLGASRGAVDAGWISRAHQVGQTGKTVSPGLYIACGISGAVQHLAGMRGAETIIAVNTDPDAPIFSIADIGVVGDLKEVIPALKEEILRYRQSIKS